MSVVNGLRCAAASGAVAVCVVVPCLSEPARLPALATSRATVLPAEFEGAIEHVVLQAVGDSVSDLVAPFRDLLRALPADVRFTIVCDQAATAAALGQRLGPTLDRPAGRVNVQVVNRAITVWARDRFIAARPLAGADCTALLVPLVADGVEVERHNDAAVVPEAVCRSAPGQFAIRDLPLLVEGGNILSSRTHVFVGRNLVDANIGQHLPTRQAVLQALATAFGKHVIIVGETFEEELPNDHIDMFLTVVDDRTMLVGRRFELPPDWPALPGTTRTVSAAADTGVPVEVRDACDLVAEELAGRGFRVRRLPIHSDRGGSNFVTFNNALLEERDGRRIAYVPAYGLPAHEREAERVYNALGFSVRFINVRPIYQLEGAVRCLANVVERRCPADRSFARPVSRPTRRRLSALGEKGSGVVFVGGQEARVFIAGNRLRRLVVIGTTPDPFFQQSAKPAKNFRALGAFRRNLGLHGGFCSLGTRGRDKETRGAPGLGGARRRTASRLEGTVRMAVNETEKRPLTGAGATGAPLRRRRPAGLRRVSSLAGVVGVVVAACLASAGPRTGLDRLQPHNVALSESPSPFQVVQPEQTLGWRWVRCGLHWREALLLQTPCRLTVRTPRPPDGCLRLLAAVPQQWPDRLRTTVRLRCSVCTSPDAGTASSSRLLQTTPQSDHEGDWEELALTVGSRGGPDVEITIEAAVEETAPGGSDPPVVALAPVFRPASDPAGPPSNCLFILVDALRADWLHCYGYPLDVSPRLDQLAAEGARFEHVVSSCSWTVPSVASLFTGTYVSTHGITAFRFGRRLGFVTLADQFRRAGAATAAISANNLIFPAAGYGRGFHEFIGAHSVEEPNAPTATWVTDQAITLLRRLKDQRFFLYLHYMDVHDPYHPPARWRMFGPRAHQLYLGEIRYCDHEIGRLLDELAAIGLDRDTLVVFIADHGEAFGEHGKCHHGGSLHGEEVNVPLIFRWPGTIAAGRRVSVRVPSIDAHATVLDLMGFGVERHLEGESLVPLLTADTSAARPAFSERYGMGGEGNDAEISLADGRYKFILDLRSKRRLLFDLEQDPGEKKNLAASHAALADRLERDVRRFLAERKGAPAARRAPDRSEQERLRALGYLAPGARRAS